MREETLRVLGSGRMRGEGQREIWVHYWISFFVVHIIDRDALS